MMRRIAAGVGASCIVSAAGLRAGALTPSGAAAAVGVGSAIVAGARWSGVAALGTFFATSSVLSRVAQQNVLQAKGGQRDATQVLANGGVAAVAALLAPLLGEARAAQLVIGALAAAAADTWSTEIGSWSPGEPRMLLNWRRAPRGTSGAVTPLGLAGSLAGALCVSGMAFAALPASVRQRQRLSTLVASGAVGALFDSLLGATLQERRWCATCSASTEAPRHSCGSATSVVGGVAGVTNDVVNLLCTLTGAVVAGVVFEHLAR
jgi:uncharacterized protein (TIGR00297 family)